MIEACSSNVYNTEVCATHDVTKLDRVVPTFYLSTDRTPRVFTNEHLVVSFVNKDSQCNVTWNSDPTLDCTLPGGMVLASEGVKVMPNVFKPGKVRIECWLYALNNSNVSNILVSASIEVSIQGLKAPRPLAAVVADVSDRGDDILITFDSDTDQGGDRGAYASRQCGRLFTFQSIGEGAICSWRDARTLQISNFNEHPNGPTFKVGDALEFLPDTIKSADGVHSMASQLQITLLRPYNYEPVSFQLQAP